MLVCAVALDGQHLYQHAVRPALTATSDYSGYNWAHHSYHQGPITMSYKERLQEARAKFFIDNPALAATIDNVSPTVIESVGMSVDDYRNQKRVEVYAKAQEASGKDPAGFCAQILGASADQEQAWRLEQHRKIASAMGMEWGDYKALNRISE